MRDRDHYEALKESERKEAEKEQERQRQAEARQEEQRQQKRHERQNANRYETLKEAHREATEPERPPQESDRAAIDWESRAEAQLEAKRQELQAKVDAGRITPRDMVYELGRLDNEHLAAMNAAAQRERRQAENQHGRDMDDAHAPKQPTTTPTAEQQRRAAQLGAALEGRADMAGVQQAALRTMSARQREEQQNEAERRKREDENAKRNARVSANTDNVGKELTDRKQIKTAQEEREERLANIRNELERQNERNNRHTRER